MACGKGVECLVNRNEQKERKLGHVLSYSSATLEPEAKGRRYPPLVPPFLSKEA